MKFIKSSLMGKKNKDYLNWLTYLVNKKPCAEFWKEFDRKMAEKIKEKESVEEEKKNKW